MGLLGLLAAVDVIQVNLNVVLPLPVYVANYLQGDRQYHFLVNGQTGEVKGAAPISWPKVAALVGIIIGAVVGIAAVLGAS